MDQNASWLFCSIAKLAVLFLGNFGIPAFANHVDKSTHIEHLQVGLPSH
jgi:hypothetical protein